MAGPITTRLNGAAIYFDEDWNISNSLVNRISAIIDQIPGQMDGPGYVTGIEIDAHRFNVTSTATFDVDVIANGIVYANDNLIVGSTTGEGGQLILGWSGTSNITGQSNSTWNVDVDSSNNLRIFSQNASGGITDVLTASTSTADVFFGGNVGIGANLNVLGSLYQNGIPFIGASTSTTSTLTINNISSSISTASGALVVTGGVGIGGKLNVGSTATIGTTATTVVDYTYGVDFAARIADNDDGAGLGKIAVAGPTKNLRNVISQLHSGDIVLLDSSPFTVRANDPTGYTIYFTGTAPVSSVMTIGLPSYIGQLTVNGNITTVGNVNISGDLNVSKISLGNVLSLEVSIWAPSNPVAGMFAVADRTLWNPASKGPFPVFPYPVFYDGSVWNALY